MSRLNEWRRDRDYMRRLQELVSDALHEAANYEKMDAEKDEGLVAAHRRELQVYQEELGCEGGDCLTNKSTKLCTYEN